MANRAGRYVTNLKGIAEYQSFLPSSLPVNINIDNEISALLMEANLYLYTLEFITEFIPSLKLFTSMYVRKEALLSSQIEGSQATLEDVLDPSIDKNINQDVSDVINYIKATEYAIERMKSLPLCNRLIKETHAVLMHDVRGSDLTPGEFRVSQNWIGGVGSTLSDARFIPPAPNDMRDCMSNLEQYINQDDDLDVLIKASLVHYQFESIHPFLDGNGRIGRLLITLFLMKKRVLSSPALSISYYLKANRVEYYDRMSEVRNTGNYEQWIKFFLKGLIESLKDAISNIRLLKRLHDDSISKIAKLGKSRKNIEVVFNYIEQNPIIDIAHTSNALRLSYNTVSSAVDNLIALGILKKRHENKRNRIYYYADYLDILKAGTI